MANGIDELADGQFARKETGSHLDDILQFFERNDIGTVGDTNTATVADGTQEPIGLVVVNDKTNDESGVFVVNGASSDSTKISEAGGGTVFGTSSGANSVNVYHDGTEYVVENQTGGDAYLETVLIRGR
jgi:hypothetical protein